MLSRVLLPLPDGPRITTSSPLVISRSTPRSARTSTSPARYVLVSSRTESTASAGEGRAAEAAVTVGSLAAWSNPLCRHPAGFAVSARFAGRSERSGIDYRHADGNAFRAAPSHCGECAVRGGRVCGGERAEGARAPGGGERQLLRAQTAPCSRAAEAAGRLHSSLPDRDHAF